MKRKLLLVFAFALLLSQPVQAAVVTVGVTIKTVDPKARGITVVYKTGTGEKTIDLDVSRKAEITINGEEGPLGSLKPGQKAKVTYEKGLQVVTKIDATGSGTAPRKNVYRITLQLSDFGDGTFRIEKTSDPPADDFQGTPYRFSRWPHTKAVKGPEGMFRLVHDFADPDDLGLLALGPPTNVAIDKGGAGLVLTSGQMPEGSQVRRAALFPYGKKLRLPLTIICDVADYGDAGFAIEVADPPRKLGLLQCKLWSQAQGLDHPFEIAIAWVEYDSKGSRNMTTLCDKKNSTLEAPFEKQFRLPLPNARITEPMYFQLCRYMGEKSTIVSRLEVRGRLAPMFGLAMAEKQGKIFAKTIFPSGPADKAGFQQGDVISAINGNRPQTLTEAVDMISKLPTGEEAVVTIERADKTQKIRVVAE